jgi:hypothetical protein
MNDSTYKCASCQGVFEKGWSDEEAAKEYENEFGQSINDEETELICDDCYDKFKNWRSKQVECPIENKDKKSGHIWHSCNDDDCFVCTGGLGQCTVCGCAESELTTHCSGEPVAALDRKNITNKQIDFLNGTWIFLILTLLLTGCVKTFIPGNECLPDEERCNNNNVEVCGKDRYWRVQRHCIDTVCKNVDGMKMCKYDN